MLTDRIVLPDGAVLDAAHGIRSVKHTSAVNTGTDLAFGSACCDMIEAELWCPDGVQPIRQGDSVTYYKGENNAAHTKIGIFLCEKPTRSSANVYRVTAYDRMSLFERSASDWLRANQGAFPLTIDALVGVACTQCGVPLAATALPRNGAYSVRPFYADNITWRQIIRWAAEAAGCFAHCNAEGALAFGWYDENKTLGIAPGNGSEAATAYLADNTAARLLDSTGAQLVVGEATATQRGYMAGSLTYEDYTVKTIDKLQISQSDSDVGVIVPEDGSLGNNTYTIKGNLLLTTDSDANLRPVAQALFAVAHSKQCAYYVPAKVSIPATLGIRAGQIITVEAASGRFLRVFVMTATTAGQKTTLECTGNISRDSSSAVNRQTYSNLTGKMLEMQASVDGLTVKASELSGAYSKISQTVDGIKTKVDDNAGHVTELSQTVEGISLSASTVDKKASIVLSVGGKEQTGTIDMTGLVSFKNLSDSGTTTINGGNITTGTIKASLLDTGTISHTNSYWNLDTGELRTGTAANTNVTLKSTGIYFAQGGQATGAIIDTIGKTSYGACSSSIWYGWCAANSHVDTGIGLELRGSGNPYGSRQIYAVCHRGLHVEGDTELNGRVDCVSLFVNGHQIT